MINPTFLDNITALANSKHTHNEHVCNNMQIEKWMVVRVYEALKLAGYHLQGNPRKHE